MLVVSLSPGPAIHGRSFSGINVHGTFMKTPLHPAFSGMTARTANPEKSRERAIDKKKRHRHLTRGAEIFLMASLCD
jgi:hypothetical protein